MRAKGQRQVRQGSGKREKGNEKKAARESKTERVSGESERERERDTAFLSPVLMFKILWSHFKKAASGGPGCTGATLSGLASTVNPQP